MRAEVRLLTLTGPPGVGKTRLALELVAEVLTEFDDGASFIDLAPIGDARLVIGAIARGLGLREVDRRVTAEVVVEYLHDKSLLLILDNFEQVLDAANVVGHLLAACPRLKVVATSRAPLHLRWEHELPVPTLQVPDLGRRPDADAVAASPAGQLFIERAHAVAPNFVLAGADAAAVAEICAGLDGLPLAIELAAARIKLFPPRALLRRLVRATQGEAGEDSPLRLLADQARDLPPRQQTLLKAIAWSYDLLDQNEQALFRRLAVFLGGCSVEAAEVVGTTGMPDGVDVIASLVDKSLVWREEQPDGEPRLHMLETIREYARERLRASDDAEAARARHAAYYIDLAEHAAFELVGPQQQASFARLERERENLRAVERRAIVRGDGILSVRLAAALWPFWLAREDAPAAREHVETFLPLVGQVPPDPALVRALHGIGLIAEKLGDYARCRALLEQGVAVARQLDDRGTLATVLDSLGRQTFIEGRYPASRVLLEESYAILRDADDPVGLARVLSHLGFLDYLEGKPAAARAIFQQGLVLARAAGDQHRVAEFMDNLGNTSESEGDFDEAARMFAEAIAIWRGLGQGHWLAMALNNLGKVQVRRGELGSARGALLEALSLSHRLGNRRRLAYTLAAVASLAAAEHQPERAARLDDTATAAMAEMGAALPRGGRSSRPMPRRSEGPSAPGAGARAGPPMTLEQALEDSLAWLTDPEPAKPVVAAGLTRREREVVALLALGQTNRQIATALVLTEGTVENYVQRILGKLRFNNRSQIAAWAVAQDHQRPQNPV
jgi:predicted ATPase/DNA-binding CsgD family transcriptional regulator